MRAPLKSQIKPREPKSKDKNNGHNNNESTGSQIASLFNRFDKHPDNSENTSDPEDKLCEKILDDLTGENKLINSPMTKMMNRTGFANNKHGMV